MNNHTGASKILNAIRNIAFFSGHCTSYRYALRFSFCSEIISMLVVVLIDKIL